MNKLSPKITVIGVGGAGGNAVNNMISSGLEGVEFLVCNTDAQALENSLADNRIQLGTEVTGGLGAGAKPDVGRAAAEESLDEVSQYLEGSHMVFITCGMGGGTGTGAAPVIARAAREAGILTVAVVTKPFHFEGTHRMKLAEDGISELQQYVDTQIVIPNQNLFRIANEKTTFAEAFKMADSVLQSGVRGVTDLMVMPGLINLDFADIRSAMQEMGKAMMGTGEATGERRAIEAAEAAISNPLLDDVSMKGARGVIINITGGFDMTLFEADEACNRIRDEVDPDANIIFGSTFDEKLENVMRVSVVATGIDTNVDKKTKPSSRGQGTVGAPNVFTSIPTPSVQPSVQQQASVQQPVAQQSVSPLAQANVATAAAPVAAPRQYSFDQAQTVKMEIAQASQVEDASAQQELKAVEDIGPVAPLRGERMGESFIPPRPVEVEQSEKGYIGSIWNAPMQYPNAQGSEAQGDKQAAFHERQQSNAPTSDETFTKKAFGFFEKLTGHTANKTAEGKPAESVQQSAGQESSAMQTEQAAPVATAPMQAPQGPSQGNLNIDKPSEKPVEQKEDELDIPAFLRRQAN